MIVAKQTVQAALARAEQLGAADIEQACQAAAQSLGIPIEALREVAYEVRTTEGAE